MRFHFTQEQLDWQQEVRDFLENAVTPELLEEVNKNKHKGPGPLEKEYQKKFSDKGWFAMNWPKEYGGLDKTAMDYFIFTEEIAAAGAPSPSFLSVGPSIVAPALFKYGTEEDREKWLPPIMKNEIDFGLGYSEPDAGTDLANLKTEAVLDGDEWVINGQKVWNTHAHFVPHQWLAVRTDNEVPKHKGISMMIVPNDAPGVTIVEQQTWGEHRTNEIFYDNVRVPKDHLIGEVNQGWEILTTALDYERVLIGGSAGMLRIYNDLIKFCRHTVIDGKLLIDRFDIRRKLAELKVDLEVAKLFGFWGASMIDSGKTMSSEASIIKIHATELVAKLADYGMQIMDLYGQLSKEDDLAPLKGRIEHRYRLAPFGRFGGGTNEVQRNIIAQRGLGLPRK